MSHRFLILTLFPEMFPGPLGHSLAGKALENRQWSFDTMQIREFAADKHKTVDDTPYGGGAGMVMKPDVLDAAISAAKTKLPNAQLVYFTPRGKPLSQTLVQEMAGAQERNFILLCSRYESVDQRVLDKHKPLEISVGDYILSGGETAAMVLMDSIIRLLPGVMGADDSAHEESFFLGEDGACLLEYSHYTRPPLWNGLSVPEVLLSGNHADIKAWRREEAEALTKTRRPDLWERHTKK